MSYMRQRVLTHDRWVFGGVLIFLFRFVLGFVYRYFCVYPLHYFIFY